MNSVARSCLRLLVVYALFGTAVGVAVHHRLPIMTVAVWTGIIAGFFVWLTFAYLWAIPSNLVDWWRMRPGVKPRDGKKSAIIGQIRTSGASLHAPFSRTACVAYHYKVISMATEHQSTDYEGFALVPSYIATEDGQVRLLAYPELDVPWERVSGVEAKQRAREYIAATNYLNTRAGGLKGLINELRQLLADDDGSIKYDYRIEPVTDDLDACRLEERVILSGDTVCAVGRYSEERRALVPDPDAGAHAVNIKKGEPGSFRGRALRKSYGSAIGVVILSVLLTGAAGLFLVNVPMDASEQMNPGRRFFWEEVRLERWLIEHVRKPLSDAGTFGTFGMHFLTLCDHCATGRLEANGRVIDLKYASGWESEATRVMHIAAAEREKDGITMTFDRKARKLQVAIVMNGRAFPVPDAWLQPEDYQTSLDSNQTMDVRITVLAPNGSIRARASARVPLEAR